MINPPKLKTGSTVGIVSTARIVRQDFVDRCKEKLESWGLKVRYGKNLFEVENQYAGSDAQRLEDLLQMLDDPEIDCILCARGGYGTLRIIDEVNLDGLKKSPKWIVGFSDVTPLLIRCWQEGIESIHGPMAISFDGSTGDNDSQEYLRKILMEEGELTYSYTPENQDVVRPGIARGVVVGGNLTMLNQLSGTKTDYNPEKCLLFFEDLDEYLYHMDRMVVHLKRSEKFEKLAGLFIGGLTDLKDNSTPFGKSGEEIILEHVAGKSFPVCFGFPVGHWEKNYPLIIGREAVLKVSHVQVEFSYQL